VIVLQREFSYYIYSVENETWFITVKLKHRFRMSQKRVLGEYVDLGGRK
jgi:hypothetical protein